jgi:hypothetical protein
MCCISEGRNKLCVKYTFYFNQKQMLKDFLLQSYQSADLIQEQNSYCYTFNWSVNVVSTKTKTWNMRRCFHPCRMSMKSWSVCLSVFLNSETTGTTQPMTVSQPGRQATSTTLLLEPQSKQLTCTMLHCLHYGDVLSSEPYQEDVAILRIDVQWSFAEMAHHVGTMA